MLMPAWSVNMAVGDLFRRRISNPLYLYFVIEYLSCKWVIEVDICIELTRLDYDNGTPALIGFNVCRHAWQYLFYR